MHLKGVTYLFSLVIVIFGITTTSAQVRRLSREAIDSIRNIKPFDTKGQTLAFEHTLHDIGAIYETDTLGQIDFNFCNVSGNDVAITKITTSCGCVTVDYPKHILPPKAKSTLKVVFNPKGMGGTVNSDIFVYTTLSDKQPTSRLSVKGNVMATDEWDFLPHKIGALRLKQKEIIFDVVNVSQKPSMRIMCANVGTSMLQLSASLLPSYASLKTEPVQLEPGAEGDIVITVDGEKLPDNVTDNLPFRIIIDGVEGSPSERTIKVLIKQIKK